MICNEYIEDYINCVSKIKVDSEVNINDVKIVFSIERMYNNELYRLLVNHMMVKILKGYGNNFLCIEDNGSEKDKVLYSRYYREYDDYKLLIKHIVNIEYKYPKRKQIEYYIPSIEDFEMCCYEKEQGRISSKSIIELMNYSIMSGNTMSSELFGNEDKYVVSTNENEIENICKEAVRNHEKECELYRNGNKKAINRVKGWIMKQTKGKFLMNKIDEVLQQIINGELK